MEVIYQITLSLVQKILLPLFGNVSPPEIGLYIDMPFILDEFFTVELSKVLRGFLSHFFISWKVEVKYERSLNWMYYYVFDFQGVEYSDWCIRLKVWQSRLNPVRGIVFPEQQVCCLSALLHSSIIHFMSNYIPFCLRCHVGKREAVCDLIINRFWTWAAIISILSKTWSKHKLLKSHFNFLLHW